VFGTDDRLARALGLAYRYLNRRDRTEAEMRAHLESKGLDSGAIERAIATLHEQGYLDDARFARLFAQDKRELEGWGRERIEKGLLARRIEPELIATALADEPAGDELDRALSLLSRRFPAPLRDPRDRDRALGVLLRKGFGAELAVEAVAAHARATQPR
jgi:regulatory protein